MYKSHNNDSAVSPGASYGNKTVRVAGCRQRSTCDGVLSVGADNLAPHHTPLLSIPHLLYIHFGRAGLYERSGVALVSVCREEKHNARLVSPCWEHKHTGHSTRFTQRPSNNPLMLIVCHYLRNS